MLNDKIRCFCVKTYKFQLKRFPVLDCESAGSDKNNYRLSDFLFQ